MLNCLLVTDYNWDNTGLISKRLSYLSENVRINLFHTSQRASIIKLCNNHNLCVFRRSDDSELLKILGCIHFCMIFTDFIEYNTHSSFVINACSKNNIPYVIFSNITSSYFYNGEICENKFKKTVSKLEQLEMYCSIDEKIDYGELVKYNKYKNKSLDMDKITDNLRTAYANITLEREKKSIILIDPLQN